MPTLVSSACQHATFAGRKRSKMLLSQNERQQFFCPSLDTFSGNQCLLISINGSLDPESRAKDTAPRKLVLSDEKVHRS